MYLSSFCVGPFQVLEGWYRVSLESSFLQAEQPQLSLFPHKRSIPSLSSFLWSSSGATTRVPCLSCAESSRAGRTTPGEISWEQSRGAESPRLTCWPHFSCSPGYSWPFGLWAHVAGSCSASCQPVPPNPSPQGYSQSILCPDCFWAWDCPNPGAGPCTWPCWTSWRSEEPTSQGCQGPSGWHAFPPACRQHQTAQCHWQTCWAYTQSHCLCSQQNVKQCRSQYQTLRNTTAGVQHVLFFLSFIFFFLTSSKYPESIEFLQISITSFSSKLTLSVAFWFVCFFS